MKVYWATRLRGFLKHVSDGSVAVEFESGSGYYEVNSFKQKLLSRAIRSKFADFIGLFSVIGVNSKKCDVYASFNRFLKCDKPYFIYLENPLALYHYSLDRIKYPLGRKRFRTCLNDKNLKGIAFMSNICSTTFEEINCAIPSNVKTRVLYPLVPNNKNIDKKRIEEKSYRNTIELLYCVQGKRFVSKGGLEVLDAVKRCKNVHLTVITKISDVDSTIIDEIRKTKDVTLLDFSFSYNELEKIYANTNILLHPSSDDSCPLTVLEAMKGGCAIVASKLYAIPEMVKDGENGFLVDPKYWFFDKNGIPNPKVWNRRNKTIYSKKKSNRMTNELVERIVCLEKDRGLLYEYSICSFCRATDDKLFGENGVRTRWEEFIKELQS